MPYILELVQRMLSLDPDERPAAKQVQERMYVILTDYCGMGKDGDSKGLLHCSEDTTRTAEMSLKFNELRIASQRAAAEACARVADIPMRSVEDNPESPVSPTSIKSKEGWKVVMPVEKVWQTPIYTNAYNIRT